MQMVFEKNFCKKRQSVDVKEIKNVFFLKKDEESLGQNSNFPKKWCR